MQGSQWFQKQQPSLERAPLRWLTQVQQQVIRLNNPHVSSYTPGHGGDVVVEGRFEGEKDEVEKDGRYEDRVRTRLPMFSVRTFPRLPRFKNTQPHEQASVTDNKPTSLYKRPLQTRKHVHWH